MVVYKITNQINGKTYVGQTVGNVQYRWNRHCSEKSGCSALKSAIKKYGKHNFLIEIVFLAKDRNELNLMEEKLILQFNSMHPNGYNLNSGGDSRKHSHATRQKLSLYIGDRNINFGKPRSDKVKKAISEAAKLRGSLGTEAAVNSRIRPIICIETGQEFRSVSEASRHFNIGTSNICKVLKGKIGQIKSFSFKYKVQKWQCQ